MKRVRRSDVLVQFGQTVRKRRIEQEWSQEEFAEKAELHRTYVADIERGVRNVSLRNLDKIAKAFDISLSELFAQNLNKGRE
jgi:transcriptional regulator with XRE-family HTH domain